MNEKRNMLLGEPQNVSYPDRRHELEKIIKSNISPMALKNKLAQYHESDISAAMEDLSAEERAKIYHALDADALADILECSKDMETYFAELSTRKKTEVLSRLEIDTVVELLRRVDKNERSLIIGFMDDESKREVALISSFDEDEIGSKLTTNYISITRDINVRQAMRELVAQAAENDNISVIYVTEENGRFYGAIDLKDLIIARESDSLESLVSPAYPYVYGREEIEECIERLKSFTEDSVPVLDDDNRLIGVITARDVVQVVDDELGEDYAMFAGLTAEEDLKEPVVTSLKKRLPWLVTLLALAMVVSSVVGLFEGIVSQLTLIVCFQSLILDMAGNVGTQSLGVTIRVLMDEKLSGKQKFGLVFKETKIGFFNGMILGVLSFVLTGLYIMLFKGKTPFEAFSISFCIGCALVVSMTLSGLSGTTVPLIFKRINIDPAIASGPLITTLNDLVAVVSYYGLAWLLLIKLCI